MAADADVIQGFVDEHDFYVPMSDIGITSKDYANAYAYTVEHATVDGKLMALTWQATPGVVAYRTDIAKKVLGSSDPTFVQSQMSDWDKFMDTAAKMKAAGYYMVSGTDDIKYAVMCERTSPWLKDGALKIDDEVYNLLTLSKQLSDNGYTKNTWMWSTEWHDNMKDDVFCYFGCTWFIPWSLAIEDTAAFGKYNVIEGPADYLWGGSYLLATDKCVDKELAALVLKTLCCDEEVMYEIFDKDTDTDYPNNTKAVEKLIKDGKGSLEKLGGQNPLPIYHAVAKETHSYWTAPGDYMYSSYVDYARVEYVDGTVKTMDEAIDLIKEQVSAAYPEIIVK